MSREQAGISAAIIMPVAKALEDIGYDTSGVDAKLRNGFLPGALADALLDDAARELRDPTIGVTIAARIPLGGLGLLDYALCTSAVLRDALRTTAKHFAMVTRRVGLAVVEERLHASVVLERRAGISHSRHWIEFNLAMIADRIRHTLGARAVFDGVAFAHDAPIDRGALDRFFGAPVSFSADKDRLTFAGTLLDAPLLTASTLLAQVLEARITEIDHGEASPLIERVRRAVLEGLDNGYVEVTRVAARLRMSSRTLQRTLRAHGTTHSTILDDVRRERALHLMQRDVRLDEVSAQLGFSEQSALFRAFRRWTGTSPLAYRRSHPVRATNT